MLTEEVNQTLIDVCLPSELRYACWYWIEHIERGGHLAAVEKQIAAFLHKHLLEWFKALSLLRLVAKGVKLLTLLGSMPVSFYTGHHFVNPRLISLTSVAHGVFLTKICPRR